MSDFRHVIVITARNMRHMTNTAIPFNMVIYRSTVMYYYFYGMYFTIIGQRQNAEQKFAKTPNKSTPKRRTIDKVAEKMVLYACYGEL